MANLTVKQWVVKMNQLKIGDAEFSEKVQLPALQLLQGLHKRRIFNDGKATDGSSIGSYRSTWKLVREKAGRQVGYKDLFFNGDLQRNILVGKNEGNYVYGFSRDKFKIIMQGQHDQTEKQIVRPSTETINKVRKVIGQKYSECLKTNYNK